MKTVVFWRISAVITKPSDVRRNRLHSSFAPKQSVCKMSESATRDKCAAGLTPGLTRNHSSQGLVSQSQVRATVTSRHQWLLALRSPQGLSWGDGDNAFCLSSPPVKHFVTGMKPKNGRKNICQDSLGWKSTLIHQFIVIDIESSAVWGEGWGWQWGSKARAERVSEADQQLSAQG